ncbi:MAG: YigZ family protein [Oscillospiraceae bacterium]|nr:YigZ family protein [Oscillospiraceae bacterium]
MAYKTIYDPAQASFVEQKSEFIGYIAPVKTNEEAVAFIESVRSENRKARHNCYAYVLRDGMISRYSDDGEPQGTAGPPILDVIQKSGLTDVCIVVTRYFGGILLGKGGLTRAYSTGASLAVNAARLMIMCEAYEVTMTLDYSLYDKINYVLPDFEIKILATDYAERITLKLLVKEELAESLHEKLVDITNGNIEISKSNKIYADFA